MTGMTSLPGHSEDVTYFDPLMRRGSTGTRQWRTTTVRGWEESRRPLRDVELPPAGRRQLALLTYNLVNYITDGRGVESVGSRWNSTIVYQRCGEAEADSLALVL